MITEESTAENINSRNGYIQVCEEQLHVLRMTASLMSEDEIGVNEAELLRQLEQKRKLKTAANLNVTEAKKAIESVRDAYDILVAEDKVMEKIFRREFSDCHGSLLDQLQKLFKKRPKGKAGATAMAMQGFSPAGLTDTGSNPYGDRPSTAQKKETAWKLVENAIQDLDSDAHMPDACSPEVWLRFCRFRRNKIDSEFQLKEKVHLLAEMTAFGQRRSDEDEKLKYACEEMLRKLKYANDCKNYFRANLQVQLVIKQGQVEIDMYVPVYDFSSTVLVHRSLAEELNNAIKTLGQQKVTAMVESKDFRKGIVQFEWAHKKLQMRMEDLHTLARDIQMLKVTKEIQQFLNEHDYDAKRVQELNATEMALEAQDAKRKREIKKKQKELHNLQLDVESRLRANGDLDGELERRNVAVNERLHVVDREELQARRKREDDRAMRAIVERRRLVEIAKEKAQEVAVLRMEVERLRMRTFPALVQVEY